MPSKKHLLVPIDLCEFVLRNKFFSPAKLYLYLKSISSGKIRLNKANRMEISAALNCTQRTLQNNLNKLRERNWIGYNKKSKMYFIRGFEKVRELEQWERRASAWWDKTRLAHSKAFFIGACLGYLSNKQKSREYNKLKDKIQVRTKKRGFQSHLYLLPTHYPIACEAIAKIYGVSKSTAYQWKKMAQEATFITVQKQLILISDSIEHLVYIRMGLEEDAHRYIVKDNKIYYQGIDKVAPKLTYKRRRNH